MSTDNRTRTALPTDIPILNKIAEGMKQMALERAFASDPESRARPVTHFFTRGAYVALQYTADSTADSNGVPQWKMWVGRDNVFPSDVEMKTFRAAFGISSLFFNDAPAQRKISDTVTRFVYVIRWYAREQPALTP